MSARTRALHLLLVAMALAMIFVAVPQPAAALDPEVTDLIGDASWRSEYRTVFVVGGRTVVFYSGTGAGADSVRFRSSGDGGATWTEGGAVSAAGSSVEFTGHQVDDDEVVLVYAVQSSASTTGVAVRRITWTGTTFALLPEVSVAQTTLWPTPLSVVDRGQGPLGGRLAVGYGSVDPLGRTEFVTRQTEDGGTTWTPGVACEPGVVEGELVPGPALQCLTRSGGTLAARTLVGLAWTDPQLLASDAGSLPSWTAEGAGVVAAFSRGTPATTVIVRRSVGATVWSAPQLLGPGARPVVTAVGPVTHVYAQERLSSLESWVRHYVVDADGQVTQGAPLGGQELDVVLDETPSWDLRWNPGDTILAAGVPGAMHGGLVGLRNHEIRLDTPSKRLSLSFVPTQAATTTELRLWVRANDAPAYRLGIQADDGSGRPTGTWLGGLGIPGLTGFEMTTLRSSPGQELTVSSPNVPLVAGQRYHVVLEPDADPLGLNTPSSSRWLAVGVTEAHPGAMAGLAVKVSPAAGAWIAEPNRVPRFSVLAGTQTVVSQERSAIDPLPIGGNTFAGARRAIAASSTVTRVVAHLQPQGSPNPNVVLRVIRGIGEEVAVVPAIVGADGWIDVETPSIPGNPAGPLALVIEAPHATSTDRWWMSRSYSDDLGDDYAIDALDRPGLVDVTADAVAGRGVRALNAGAGAALYFGASRPDPFVALTRILHPIPSVRAEYFDGSSWTEVPHTIVEKVAGWGYSLDIPSTWPRAEVAGRSAHWMRLRPVTAGFGADVGRMSQIREWVDPSVPPVAASGIPMFLADGTSRALSFGVADAIGPNLVHRGVGPGATTLAPRPVLSIDAADAAWGVEGLTAAATIDSLPAAVSVDAGGVVRIQPDSDLAAGNHSAHAVVRDRDGNASRRTWTFLVAQVTSTAGQTPESVLSSGFDPSDIEVAFEVVLPAEAAELHVSALGRAGQGVISLEAAPAAEATFVQGTQSVTVPVVVSAAGTEPVASFAPHPDAVTVQLDAAEVGSQVVVDVPEAMQGGSGTVELTLLPGPVQVSVDTDESGELLPEPLECVPDCELTIEVACEPAAAGASSCEGTAPLVTITVDGAQKAIPQESVVAWNGTPLTQRGPDYHPGVVPEDCGADVQCEHLTRHRAYFVIPGVIGGYGHADIFRITESAPGGETTPSSMAMFQLAEVTPGGECERGMRTRVEEFATWTDAGETPDAMVTTSGVELQQFPDQEVPVVLDRRNAASGLVYRLGGAVRIPSVAPADSNYALQGRYRSGSGELPAPGPSYRQPAVGATWNAWQPLPGSAHLPTELGTVAEFGDGGDGLPRHGISLRLRLTPCAA